MGIYLSNLKGETPNNMIINNPCQSSIDTNMNNMSIRPNFSYMFSSLNNTSNLANQLQEENFVNANNYPTRFNYNNNRNMTNGVNSMNNYSNSNSFNLNNLNEFQPNAQTSEKVQLMSNNSSISNEQNNFQSIKNPSMNLPNSQRFKNFNNRKTLYPYQGKCNLSKNYNAVNQHNNLNCFNSRPKYINNLRKSHSLHNCIQQTSMFHNHEVLTIKIKVQNSEKLIKVNKYDDYLEISKKFCKLNNLPDSLIKPISIKINLAISSINDVFNKNLSKLDCEYLQSLNKLWESLSNKERRKSLDKAAMNNIVNPNSYQTTCESYVNETNRTSSLWLNSSSSEENNSLSTHDSQDISFNNISTISFYDEEEEDYCNLILNNTF